MNVERESSHSVSNDNTFVQRGRFYDTRELENRDIRELEYLIRYNTKPTHVLNSLQGKENQGTEQDGLAFPREIISDSTIADSPLLKKLVQSSKVADENSLKENRESVKYTFVKNIGNEPHVAYGE